MNEHLDSLEDAIQDLNKVLKEVEKKEEVVVRFPPKQSTSTAIQNQASNNPSNAQCTWRISPPANTTLNVRCLSLSSSRILAILSLTI